LFEFVALSARRTEQLMQGCMPRVPGTSKATVLAQREVAAGLVQAIARPPWLAVAPPRTAPEMDRVDRGMDSGKSHGRGPASAPRRSP
jgi:hypothetical protein